MTDSRLSTEQLLDASVALLCAAGAHPTVADDTARALVESSRCGVDTHGVTLLPRILDRVRAGRSQVSEPATPTRTFEQAVAVVEGRLTPGQHATMVATREAIDRARRFGIGHVAVRNSTHFGGATPFLRFIIAQGLVGFVGSNSLRSMGAFGLERANLGNNPFGFAAPGLDGPDFLFDFSAGVMSFGRRAEYRRRGEPLPEGTFITPDPTSTPADGVAEIADSLEQIAVPFGGFKGASVAVMVEVLGGLLSAGHVGRATETMDGDTFRGPSHFVMALDPAAFDVSDFAERAADYFGGIRRGDADVRLPGDRLAATVTDRDAHGIPVDPTFVADLTSRAADLGAHLPFGP